MKTFFIKYWWILLIVIIIILIFAIYNQISTTGTLQDKLKTLLGANANSSKQIKDVWQVYYNTPLTEK